jgi:GT2 family glycosyltransferase
VGETAAVGGIAVLRRAAVEAVGGYRDSLIAGEEPELCLRLRRAGWKICRLEAEMALHDIAMTQLSQWWRRARRHGHAIAEGAALHGAGPERYCRAEVRRALIWGLGVPLTALLGTLVTPRAFLLVLLWPAQVLRLRARGESWVQAFFLVLGKLPEAQGILGYYFTRGRTEGPRIIEYK